MTLIVGVAILVAAVVAVGVAVAVGLAVLGLTVYRGDDHGIHF